MNIKRDWMLIGGAAVVGWMVIRGPKQFGRDLAGIVGKIAGGAVQGVGDAIGGAIEKVDNAINGRTPEGEREFLLLVAAGVANLRKVAAVLLSEEERRWALDLFYGRKPLPWIVDWPWWLGGFGRATSVEVANYCARQIAEYRNTGKRLPG